MLIDHQRWTEESNAYSHLFRKKQEANYSSPDVKLVEEYWKNIYERPLHMEEAGIASIRAML